MLNPEKPSDVILYLQKRKGFIKLALLTVSFIYLCNMLLFDVAWQGKSHSNSNVTQKYNHRICFINIGISRGSRLWFQLGWKLWILVSSWAFYGKDVAVVWNSAPCVLGSVGECRKVVSSSF